MVTGLEGESSGGQLILCGLEYVLKETGGGRLHSVDAVRGVVMIIMALDHTRDFFHSAAMSSTPEDLSRTWPALFFTRWITHLCAPAFMMLAGLSAWLWQSKGRSAGQLSGFLWKRGVWLIVLELTVVRFAMFFNVLSGPVLLLVLWALGWSMVALAGLVHLPRRFLVLLSLGVVAGHNLADPVAAASFGSLAWVWNILHQPGAFVVSGVVFVVGYPLIPWVAVMALGYCLGPVFTGDAERRRRFLAWSGGVCVAVFVLVRALNVYGDPRPWSAAVWPVLSFLNTTKYPPSLSFLLMTLGPVLLLLRVFDGVRLSRANPLEVFGRTPLFFFVVHFFLIHLLTFPAAVVRYGAWRFLLNPAPSMGGSAEAYPPEYGYSLWTVYGFWALVIAVMYPLCRYYSARRSLGEGREPRGSRPFVR